MGKWGSRLGNWGSKLALCVTLAVPAVYVPPAWTAGAEAFEDTSAMSDGAFFGVWDEGSGSGSWTTTGKLNYGHAAGLASVETAVKAGDYTLAKQELLAYYRGRTGHGAFPLATTGTFLAELVADNILTAYSEYAESQFTVGPAYATVSTDVTGGVRSVAAVGGRELNLYLMGRHKDDTKLAQFYSREQSANKPVLELVVDGVPLAPIVAAKDTYTQPGQTVKYGSANVLEVRDSGLAASAPFDNNTRRAFLSFELPVISGAVTSATVKLYGKSSSGTMDVLVMRTDASWGEQTLDWQTQASNTFSYQGVPTGPDWLQPASGAFNEYYWLINRFQFIGPLAAAYSNSVAAGTPAETFASHTIRLMLDYIGSSFGSLQPHNYTRSLDVSFRGIVWPRLLEVLWDSPTLDAEALSAILKNLWQTADWLAYDPAGFTGFNWAVNESKGLYATAAYLPEFADAAGWRDVAEQRLNELLSTLTTLDGGYAEPSYNYTWVSLGSFYDVQRIADLNGQQISAAFRSGILKLAHFLMDMTLPNGYDPVYGDGHYSNFSATLKMIGNDLGDPELVYAGSVGDPARSGMEPQHTSAYYPDNRAVMMRSGWQPDDRFLFFANSAGPHGHPDQNAVIAYAYGKVLLTDTGVNSYLSSNPVSAWQFNNTESHNTVRINGVLQAKHHNIASVNNDTIDRFATNGYFDFTEGTTYSTPGFAHTRSVLFVRPDYWIVSDHVSGGDGSSANAIEQNWHFLPGANPTLDPATKRIQTQFVGEPNIQLVPADPGLLSVAELRDGYYDRTDAYNAKFGKYGKTSASDVSFDTVLMPTDTGESRNVQVTRLATTPSVGPETASALRIDLDAGAGGNTAYYYLSHEAGASQERQFGDYSYDGKLSYVEETAGGALAAAAIAEGSTLKQDNRLLIQSEERVKDLAVRWTGAGAGSALEIDGGQLVLDSSPATAIAIYAPDAASVTVNGKPVSYVRQGDYVYAVRAAMVEAQADRDYDDRQGAGDWSYMNGATPLVWSQAGSGTGTAGSDSFGATTLGSQWAWAGTPTANWSLTDAPGKLRIMAESGDTWGGGNNQKNILLQQPMYPDYTVETKVSFANTSNYQAAGLILYDDDDNYIKLDRAYNSAYGGKIIRLVREYRTNPQTEFRDGGLYVADTFGSGDVYFRLRKQGEIISAYYSGDGVTWSQIGKDMHIPLKAPRAGLHAMNTNTSLTVGADFDYFNVTQLLPEHWSGGGGGDPIIAKDYVLPGASADAVRQWVAPAAGTLSIEALVASYAAYPGGDGFRVKVTRDGAAVWPASGWQEVARDDTDGYAIVETIPVAKGDVISFVTNSGAAGNAVYDVADWRIRLTLAPGLAAQTSRFTGSGGADDWTPFNGGRWAIASGGGAGGDAYTLTATGYAEQSGGRPGEYVLRADAAADRYTLSLKAKLGDDVGTNPQANAVVVFDYQDADNYYFARLDNSATEVRVYKVKGGVAVPLAGSNATDWLQDNAFHAVAVLRNGGTGEIEVRLDGKPILRAWDREFRGGQFGVGSMNGSAAFDDVTVVNLSDRTDSFDGTALHPDWQWVREEPDYWSLTAVPGKLRITAVTQSDIWKTSNNQTNLLGKLSPYEDFTLTTEMAYSPLANYQSAGLLAYVGDSHYVKVERVYNSALGGAAFRVVRENGELNAVTLTAPDTLGTAPVHLKMVKQGANFTGYYSADGVNWTQIGSSALTYAVNVPMRVGLHAQRSGGATPIPADFSYFRLAPTVEGDRLYGSVPVRVVGDHGLGLSGVTVEYFRQDGLGYHYSDVTDGSGEVVAVVPPEQQGDGWMTVRATLYGQSVTQDVYLGMPSQVTMYTRAVDVRVEDASGAPLSGVEVRTAWPSGLSYPVGTTAADGKVTVQMFPGDYTLKAAVSGVTGQLALTVGTAGSVSATVRVPLAAGGEMPAASLTGSGLTARGESFGVTYGLAVPEGVAAVYAQDVTFAYDATRFEYVSAVGVAGSGTVVGAVYDQPEIGVVRVVLTHFDEPLQDGGADVLQLNFTAKTTVGVGMIGVLQALTADAGGAVTPADVSGALQLVEVLAEFADRAGLGQLLDVAQGGYDAALVGYADGNYPAYAKSVYLTAITVSRAVYEDALATGPQVTVALNELSEAQTKFAAYRIVPTMGDFNGSGLADIGDVGLLSQHYGKRLGDPGWNPVYDLDGDEEAGLYELVFLARRLLGLTAS